MNRQSGFTLIEIIAVLVILGILAAVAIPKYQNLQQQAQIKALQGMAAAGLSQMTMVYSRALLMNNGDNGAAEDALTNDVCSGNVTLTEGYSISCTSGDGVSVTAPDGSTTFTTNWVNP